MTNPFTITAKEFNKRFDIAHHSRYREHFNPKKLFAPVMNRLSVEDRIALALESNEKEDYELYVPPVVIEREIRMHEKLRETYFIINNKPEQGTGLWCSFILPDGSTSWFNYISKDRKFKREYIRIEPSKGARILMVDSLESLYYVDQMYNYDYEKMSKDYDVLVIMYEEAYKSFTSSGPYKGNHLNVPRSFDGWDCPSVLFLNDTFTVGSKMKIAKEVEAYKKMKKREKKIKKMNKKSEEATKKLADKYKVMDETEKVNGGTLQEIVERFVYGDSKKAKRKAKKKK